MRRQLVEQGQRLLYLSIHSVRHIVLFGTDSSDKIWDLVM